MNWKYKAIIASVLSRIPYGNHVQYLLQKHMTKTLPASDDAFLECIEVGRKHLSLLTRHETRSLSELQFFEFGSGWDLKFPFIFYACGVDKQILSDVQRLVKTELVHDTIAKLHRLSTGENDLRVPPALLDEARSDSRDKWLGSYGMEYRAPYDARRTGMPSETIDCVTSISVMEHIPLGDLSAILYECYRILRPDGWALMRIDYTDHYAPFDENITHYNFLRYSDHQWARWNSLMIYQNRLRHSDYARLFAQAGFEVIDEDTYHGSKESIARLSEFPLDEKYRSYELNDLAVCGSNVLLRKIIS